MYIFWTAWIFQPDQLKGSFQEEIQSYMHPVQPALANLGHRGAW